MKNSVPGTAKIAKDAKECVQECVSEFISFITSEAAEKCALEKRKTIGGEDILYAMINLGFENYAEVLKIHLAKLRQVSMVRYNVAGRQVDPNPMSSSSKPRLRHQREAKCMKLRLSLDFLLLAHGIYCVVHHRCVKLSHGCAM